MSIVPSKRKSAPTVDGLRKDGQGWPSFLSIARRWADEALALIDTEDERNPQRRQGVSAITGDVFGLALEMVALLEPFSIEERALARRLADETLALIDRKEQP